MKKITSIFCLVGLIIICLGGGSASASILDWKTYETDNFVVFYPQDYDWQAQEVLYYLEENLAQVKQITGNQDNPKSYVVVQDFGVQSNGLTNPLHNRISVYTNQAASYSLELGNYKNWYRSVYTHELAHMLQLTNYSESAEIPVNIFGRSLSPNVLYVPRWLAEGVAIYSESQVAEQVGRLNNNYYQAIVQARAKAGRQLTLSQLTTYPYYDYPADLRYVYGAEFYRYLVNEYGADKSAQLFKEVGASFFSSLDQSAQQVFGKSMPHLFKDWKREQQEASQDWRIAGDKVVATKAGAISGLTAANDKLYYFKSEKLTSFPNQDSTINYLVEYNPTTGEETNLRGSIAPNYGTIEVVNDKVYYTVKTIDHGFANIQNNGLGAQGLLYCYNLETGRNKQVLSGQIKSFAVLKTGEIIYTTQNQEEFGSLIWKYQAGTTEQLGSVAELISELEVAHDSLLAVSKERVGSWDINYLKLDNLSLTSLVATKSAERAVNVRGDKLYYTAQYDDQQSIYEYDLASQQLAKLTQEGFAFNGVVVDNQVYFRAPSATGIELYSKVRKPNSYKLPQSKKKRERAKAIDLAELKSEIEQDRAVRKNLSGLFPPARRIFPILASGQDALGANSYTIGYGGSITWTTKLFNPLAISVSSIPQTSNRKTNLDLSYPIYDSATQGLTDVTVEYRTDFSNSIPGLGVDFSYLQQELEFNLQGDLKQQGLNSELIYKYNLPNSGVKITGSRFNNFAQQDNLRGAGVQFTTGDNGYKLSTEYIHKLLEFRQGLWSQRLFLADIYGNLFLDYATNFNTKQDETASGYELLFETSWWEVPFTIKLGSSYYEGRLRPVYGLQVDF